MLIDTLTIRPTEDKDRSSIRDLCIEAFTSDYEATICNTLYDDATVTTISLVAVDENDHVVGHVLFSEGGGPVRIALLGPLAVACEARECGIGRLLVRKGLIAAKEAGFDAIFVLGAAPYYGQFGFKSALADAFESPYQGLHFQALELRQEALTGQTGPITYPTIFEQAPA